MPKPSSRHVGGAHVPALVLASLALALPAAAQQQHAHTHGRLALDAAVDAQSITLAVESPLDNFLGFERAPRTDAERKRVSDLVARLNAADQLFQPDPAAGCKLSKVDLQSAALGLGRAGEAHGHDHDHGEHADIDMSVVFTCADAAQARFIDVRLFDAYKRLRTIDAQVASPQGQFKRTLRPGAARLSLAR
ncbi:MAG: DUF2796 domain-containing protein [Ottowia sp.]|uniref:DUF2796 domain-containing protein n=1 Tax=Ottowia sp. TaxID=1898956 RepID=UPI0039E62470